MDKICICIAYDGRWTTDYNYLDHETKLILVNDEITFEGLVEKICQFLKLKRGEIEANIWFDTKLETSKGMRVTNDEEVTTCIYLLRNNSNFKTSRFIVDIPEGNSSPAKNIKPKYLTTKEITEEPGQTSYDKKVRRLARLSRKRKRSTIHLTKGKRSTRKGDDLPTVVLREDASLDDIVVGSIFEDKKSLKKCFLDNAIKHHFKIKVERSTHRICYLKCRVDECSWCMHSSQVRDSALFKICKFEKNHSCSSGHRHITAKVISNYVIELLRDTKAEIKPSFVVEEVRKRYGLSISYQKARRATQLALGVLGIAEQNHMNEESNPKTCTDIKRDDLPTVVLREDASLDEIAVGSIFEDKKSLKKCFLQNAIKHHFKIKVDRSTHRICYLKCSVDKCSWCMHSSQFRDSALFKICKFEKNHSCSSDQQHITAKVISDYIIELVRDTKEEIKPGFVVEEVKKRYGMDISYHKAWRATHIALGVLGIPEQNHINEESNPTTCTDTERDDLPAVVLREDASLDEIVMEENPESCPPCLHSTEECNLETSADIERDEQIKRDVLPAVVLTEDASLDEIVMEENPESCPPCLHSTEECNLETSADIERDEQIQTQ